MNKNANIIALLFANDFINVTKNLGYGEISLFKKLIKSLMNKDFVSAKIK